MSYPVFYSNNPDYLHASSTTSNANFSVAVPARARYISCWYATTPGQAHTAAVNEVWPAINGVAIAGSTATAVGTSTGDSATKLKDPSVTQYLAEGDVLSVVCSSCTGGRATFIVQEY